MNRQLTAHREVSPGFKARKLRIAQMLTRQELAQIAGVSPEDVDLLEHNLPLRMEAKLNLFQALWARKGHQE